MRLFSGLMLLVLSGLLAWFLLETPDDSAPLGGATGSESTRANAANAARADRADLVTPEESEFADVQGHRRESASPAPGERGTRIQANGRVVAELGSGRFNACSVMICCGPRATVERTLSSLFSRAPALHVSDATMLDEAVRVADIDGELFCQELEVNGRGEFRSPELELQETHVLAVKLYLCSGWISDDPPRYWSVSELLRGELIEIELRPWPPAAAGSISGILRTENGGFPAHALPDIQQLAIQLESVGAPTLRRQAGINPSTDARGGRIYEFLVEDVPDCPFEVSVSSSGTYEWSPDSIVVSPPAAGLEFVRLEAPGELPITFRVVDAETGTVLRNFDARRIRHGIWEGRNSLLGLSPIAGEQFGTGESLEWCVWADGYATHFGNQDDLHDRGDRREAIVELRRGWNTLLVVAGQPHGAERGALEGAQVLFDDEFVGLTDAAGKLLVERDFKPAEIRVRYQDWEPSHRLVPWRDNPTLTPVNLVEPNRD